MTSDSATKEQLLAQIRDGYNTFGALLRSVRPGDQLRPLGDWTVAEHVAHIASWEQLALAVVTGIEPHEAMGITAEEWSRDTDGINQALHARHAGISFEDARSIWSKVHNALVAAIEAASEEDLQRSLGSGDEDRVSDVVAGNSFGHYEEHAGWIREALGR